MATTTNPIILTTKEAKIILDWDDGQWYVSDIDYTKDDSNGGSTVVTSTTATSGGVKVPEWDSSYKYNENDIVASDGILYVSKQNVNQGNAPVDGTFWWNPVVDLRNVDAITLEGRNFNEVVRAVLGGNLIGDYYKKTEVNNLVLTYFNNVNAKKLGNWTLDQIKDDYQSKIDNSLSDSESFIGGYLQRGGEFDQNVTNDLVAHVDGTPPNPSYEISAKIGTEFNKLISGVTIVGNAALLSGKGENDLRVLDSTLLNNKPESGLNVASAVSAQKTVELQSFDENGQPKKNLNGDDVFIKEHQLSVYNSKLLDGSAPINLEVDVARRLKFGDQENSPIFQVTSLIYETSGYNGKPVVFNSYRLGGKLESELNVAHANEAGNTDTIDGKHQNELVVEQARIATKLVADDNSGDEVGESELRVKSARFIRNNENTQDLTLFNIKEYVLGITNGSGVPVDAKEVYVNLAASSNTLTSSGGNRSFDDIIQFIKDDSSVESYKSTRLVTVDGAKTGEDYKNWVLQHNDFETRIGQLNANTADRAIRFGSSTDNVNIDEMDSRIKATTVDQALNSNTVQGQTDEDIISTTRNRIFGTAGSTKTTATEAYNFFHNANVRTEVQAIKVDEAYNADTITDTNGTSKIGLTDIYQHVKDTGQVLSSKYIYADPVVGGQKSYIDITNDINTAKTDIIGGASVEYNTLKEIEDIVKANKTSIETSLSTEITNRTNFDNTLQNNIDVETGRIDTILSGADADKDTFVGIKNYVDVLVGDLSISTTVLGNNVDLNVVNITNTLEERLVNFEGNSTLTSQQITNRVNNIIDSVDLTSQGNFPNINGNYVGSASTVLEAIDLLDIALKAEENTRISEDTTLELTIGDLSTLSTTNKTSMVVALNEEISRAISIEGTLSSLNTTEKTDLVSAINSLVTDLVNESTQRTNEDTALSGDISSNTTAISNEESARIAADGDLTLLDTFSKGNLVSAINEVHGDVNDEVARATAAEGTLQGNIDTVSNSITTETSRASGVEGPLASLTTSNKGNLVSAINELDSDIGDKTLLSTSNKGNLVAGINSEVARATAAESTLQSTLQGNITTEVSRATDAESTLQGNIDTETDRLDKIVSATGFSNIDTVGTISFTGTNYLNAQNNVKNTFTTLDTQIASNFNNLDTRVTTIAGLFDADNNKITSAVTIEGNTTINGVLNISGNILPNTDITYDLGSSTNRFKDLYLNGNTIYMGDYTVSVNQTTGVLSTNNTTNAEPAVNLVTEDDIGNTIQAHSTILDNTTASYTTAEKTTVSHITVTQSVDLDSMETKLSGIAPFAQANDPNTTLMGNVFNGSDQLVKMTNDSKLPVVDGSNITNINASTINGLTVETSVPVGAVFTDTNTLAGLSDVDFTAPPQPGYVISFDGSKWLPTVPSAGGAGNTDLSNSVTSNDITINSSTGQSTTIAAVTNSTAGIMTSVMYNEHQANNVKISNVSTNISITHNSSDVFVNSSDGTSGTLNAATVSSAGVMSSSDKTKLDNIITNGDGSQLLSNDGTYKTIDSVVSEGASTLTFNSASTITMNATDSVKVTGAPFQLPLFTTVARDALTAQQGFMIFNTDVNKFQGYDGTSWVNLNA